MSLGVDDAVSWKAAISREWKGSYCTLSMFTFSISFPNLITTGAR